MKLGNVFRWLVLCGLIGLVVFWWVTRPSFADPDSVSQLTGDPSNGELIFYAGGCSSCHAAPNAEEEDKLKLGGGLKFVTDFGTFFAPNISPHENGIGGWSALDLVNAMKHGVSPDGAHYFPAFPYTSYAKAEISDIVDLKAYLDTLPAVETENIPHDVGFPFNIRRSLGGWKFMFLKDNFELESDDPVLARGRYLVEGLGHCAECHTSRNAIGGLDLGNWMAGGPNPDGKGTIPNITPHESGLAEWSEVDIVEYLTSGFTPEYDVAGGQMTDVVGNTSQLPKEDREAIAAYLKAIPALPRVR